MDLLPKPANISEMFRGCVGEVRSQKKKEPPLMCGDANLLVCSGVHQQQEGGPVLQLYGEQSHPDVCGQQPLRAPALPERRPLPVQRRVRVPVSLHGRIRGWVQGPEALQAQEVVSSVLPTSSDLTRNTVLHRRAL